MHQACSAVEPQAEGRASSLEVYAEDHDKQMDKLQRAADLHVQSGGKSAQVPPAGFIKAARRRRARAAGASSASASDSSDGASPACSEADLSDDAVRQAAARPRPHEAKDACSDPGALQITFFNGVESCSPPARI